MQRRSEQRRGEILRAASRVFRRRGYDGASMKEIAAEADLSPGNLYYYFTSKPEILYYCQARTLERLQAAADAARDAGGPPADQLARVIRAHILVQLDEIEGSAAHLEIDAVPATLRPGLIDKRDAYERTVAGIVEAGIRQGAFHAPDPRLVTRAILGALNWTARWYRPDGERRPAEIADAFAVYLVHGLTSGAGVMTPAGDGPLAAEQS